MSNKEFDVEEYLNMELLRFTTAGSVDDGKSTLIGRMLYDSKAIFQDQMEALEKASELRGEEDVNLALLTDGLRAEREQGITIDVAYRYFSTPKRKFIIADTPGHVQYTRNMVTGASTADLAIILIDARNGILTQSKRHALISSLLGIPHVLVAVNKMDLVDYSQDVYNEIVAEFKEFCEKLNIHDITFMPISALMGDNVVEHGTRMLWYDGPTVMSHLENVTIAADRNLVDFRFPVQYVLRPNQDFRGFASRIPTGTIRKGEEIMVLPSEKISKIKNIVTADGELEEAFASQSVVLTLEDEIDISRGDMIVRSGNIPEKETRFDAMLCWMDDADTLKTNQPYIMRHTTRDVNIFVRDIHYKIDMNTLHREDCNALELNEIGRIEIEAAKPLFFDAYEKNRETGSFILIDPHSNQTVAGGMIQGRIQEKKLGFKVKKGSNYIFAPEGFVSRANRETKNGHKGHVLWLTGLSGSGKSTIAQLAEKELFDQGKQVYLLDGDRVRNGLNEDLGFSEQDRNENIRRIGQTAKLFYDAGHIVLCSFISPYREMRDYVRSLFPEGAFSEVFIDCSIETCKKRDVKGLYKKAEEGLVLNFTGVSAPYEKPSSPEIIINTSESPIESSYNSLMKYLNHKLY